MTATNIDTNKPALVETLLAKGFKLSGSRLLGTWHDDSDWDLYAEYTEETRKELEGIGFTRLGGSEYENDTNCVMVMEKIDAVDLVQVALVKDVQVQSNILELLMNNENWREYDRSLKGLLERKMLWDFLFHLQKKVE
jgi:hypothetical protein